MDRDVQKSPYLARQLSVSKKTGGLNRATSKFVSARLGPDGVQSGQKDVYWFGLERSYVRWVLVLLVLSCTGVLVVRVTSFRERERIPGLFLRVVRFVSILLDCVYVLSLDCLP
jgi:hypothetical protein